MRIEHSTSYVAFMLASCAAVTMMGCPGQCPVGHEIVIPAADPTAPGIVLDFILPSGQIVSASPASSPSVVTVPGGGTVTLTARASDDEGVRDVQLWVGTKTCTFNPDGTATCAGPGAQGAPTASNPDTRAAGQQGCSARLATLNLVVSKTATREVSHEVQAIGLNFGNGTAQTPFIKLVAQ